MSAPVPTEWYLAEELTALEEEGYDVAEPRRQLAAIAGQERAHAERRAIADSFSELRPRADFAYEEPSDLVGLRAARPEGPRKLDAKLSASQLKDHTLGAWLGRAAGCLLGKPCEGWHRREIESVLRLLGEWPLSAYWPRRNTLPQGLVFWGQEKPEGARYYPSPNSGTLRENITRMERDDDMDYPILGLALLEEKGLGFTTRDVGATWLNRLPYHCVYTAERVTYRNLVDGLEPPATATYQNPYREWIGAQIRADIWGWVAPGHPEYAAELAFRDASLSHTKNGIYGEMFFAALLAAAFVEPDLHRLLEIGLSEIPATCRLREAVLDTVEWCDQDPDWEVTWAKINGKYGHYHGVHTINNAALVIMGLLHAKGDYEKAIAISVMGGWDTDCNGATAGSVMGTLLGAKALPAKWIAPLHDRISSIVTGYSDMKISELAKRTQAVVRS